MASSASDAPRCEWDGTLLTFDVEGLEEACPECERELTEHAKSCPPCRINPNMPEHIGENLVQHD